MKLIEWAPNDQSLYTVTAAELRELVLECSVAYASMLPRYSVQQAEWARNRKFGTMMRKLTCREEGP